MPGRSRVRRESSGRLASFMENGAAESGKQVQLGIVVQAEELIEILNAVFDDSGALMIARTSDGGALCFTFYVDGERVKRYITSREGWLALHSALVQ